MKEVTVTINPTEIRSVSYNSDFSIVSGAKVDLNVRTECAIRPNPNNPVVAVVCVKVEVANPEKTVQMVVETMTVVTVSTFVDDLEEFIKENYMAVILVSANEKVRSISALMGMPIKIPNPKFGEILQMEDIGSESYEQ